MRVAAPPLALLFTALASVATSPAHVLRSGQHTVEGVSLDEPVALDLQVRTTGELPIDDVTDLGVRLHMFNEGPTSALVEVYQLSEAFDGALPDDAVLLGDGMARGALGEEPGAVGLDLRSELNPRAPIHLVVLSDTEGVSGDITVTATAWYSEDVPEGAVKLVVLP